MRNNFWLGLLIGIVFPLIAFLLTRYTNFVDTLFAGKQLGFYAIAAMLNFLLVRQLYRPAMQQDKVAKGVVLITFLAMLLFLYTHKISI